MGESSTLPKIACKNHGKKRSQPVAARSRCEDGHRRERPALQPAVSAGRDFGRERTGAGSGDTVIGAEPGASRAGLRTSSTPCPWDQLSCLDTILRSEYAVAYGEDEMEKHQANFNRPPGRRPSHLGVCGGVGPRQGGRCTCGSRTHSLPRHAARAEAHPAGDAPQEVAMAAHGGVEQRDSGASRAVWREGLAHLPRQQADWHRGCLTKALSWDNTWLLDAGPPLARGRCLSRRDEELWKPLARTPAWRQFELAYPPSTRLLHALSQIDCHRSTRSPLSPPSTSTYPFLTSSHPHPSHPSPLLTPTFSSLISSHPPTSTPRWQFVVLLNCAYLALQGPPTLPGVFE